MIKNNLTFGFYFNEYNNGCEGCIPAEKFNLYIAKAKRELEPMLTSADIALHEEKIKLTICEIAEELYGSEDMRSKKSESTDGYSVTYADGDFVHKNIVNIAVRNLGDTGLLYLGVE